MPITAHFVASTVLPTAYGTFEARVFQEVEQDKEHLVLLAGQIITTPLVRLHSECLTGDALGSLRCDCGPQLQEAQRQVLAQAGIIIYLRQEGRGIGLANKIRAYALQDGGMDTVEANLHLGFGADLRDYGVAAAILRQLNVMQVRLLTNNPAKVAGLSEHGIAVVEQVPLVIRPNPHNTRYLNTKRDRLNHTLPHLNGKLIADS